MKKIALYLLAIFYIVAGINHFWKPQSYDGLIPPYLPLHLFINLFAGSAEIVLGIALLLPISRKWAVYGIIGMLLAFIPAHIYFIQIGSCIPEGLCVPQWVGWLRLIIIHPLLIAWAWWCRK
jgi:uncharacterized membrane protein